LKSILALVFGGGRGSRSKVGANQPWFMGHPMGPGHMEGMVKEAKINRNSPTPKWSLGGLAAV